MILNLIWHQKCHFFRINIYMAKGKEKIFGKLSNQEIEVPEGLFEKIILSIEREKEIQKIKRALFLLIIALILMPFSFKFFLVQIKESGLNLFLSLILTDFSTILTFWKDFVLTLVEFLPIFGIIFLFANVVFLLIELRTLLNKKDLINSLFNYQGKLKYLN